MLQVFIIFTIATFYNSCSSQNRTPTENHKPTEIWFDLHLTTDEEQSRLDSLIAKDTTYWGVHSAPFFFRMPGHGDNSTITLNNGPFNSETEVRIYALGEAIDERMVDFGWLVNTSTNDTVWKMTYANTRHAGGDKRNRKFEGDLNLPPGAYQLQYVTNGSHSSKSWEGDPPENPDYWGVLIYRTAVVEKIKNE